MAVQLFLIVVLVKELFTQQNSFKYDSFKFDSFKPGRFIMDVKKFSLLNALALHRAPILPSPGDHGGTLVYNLLQELEIRVQTRQGREFILTKK